MSEETEPGTLAAYEHLDKRLDNLEQMIAQLTLAYTEVASGLESLMIRVMEPVSEADKKSFREQLAKNHRQTMAKVFQATQDVIKSEPDNPVDTAIAKMVKEYQASGPDEE